MKNILYKLLLFGFSFLSFGFTFPSRLGGGVLSVVIDNIMAAQGTVRVVLFNSQDNFLERDGYVYKQTIAVGNKKSVKLDFQIPHAYYVVSAYHDINDNHTLDRNALGLPIEPYALSNNPTVKWRKPSFDETKFAFNQANQTIYLGLKLWKER
ncbi:MAG: DUF2141 domain-containing protein [Saprospiraceae bacterium]|nr:DUF2141 domain-containing protein [Saprospiraceae bacterium]